MAKPESPTRAGVQDAVDRNYEAFCKRLPELLKTNAGQFALLRNEEIIEFFTSAREAAQHGRRTFDDDLFSVQEVTDETVDLGWFSHVVS